MTSVASTSTSVPSIEPEFQNLDVCSFCADTSSSMTSCPQCKNFIFCGKHCAKKCPCLEQSQEILPVVPPFEEVMFDHVNRVTNKSSVIQTCNYTRHSFPLTTLEVLYSDFEVTGILFVDGESMVFQRAYDLSDLGIFPRRVVGKSRLDGQWYVIP